MVCENKNEFMSAHFHPLQIKEVKNETADCVSLTFDVPETLLDIFKFKQGQSLTMKTIIDGEEIRRTYSICSSPLENILKVGIKKIGGGKFSTFANDHLKKGDVLDVMEPVGNFYCDLHPSNKKNYIAFAAGSGITPVLSLIKTTLAIEKESVFTLIYNNKNSSSIIFFEELEGLKNKYMNRFQLIHVLSREQTDTSISFGRITKEKLIELSRVVSYSDADEIFLCGPEEMIFCIKDYLEAEGIEKQKIHFELFSSTTTKKSEVKNNVSTKTNAAKTSITIKTDGRTFEFDLEANSELSILDAALQQGVDLPFACKGGMCCTCKAKLVEGTVEMDVHWGLEEVEKKRGFILTCQSHPKTEKIVVNFDIK